MGGELRHRAIRDSLKVTQEFSGRAGEWSQHFLSVMLDTALPFVSFGELRTGALAWKLHPKADWLQVVAGAGGVG